MRTAEFGSGRALYAGVVVSNKSAVVTTGVLGGASVLALLLIAALLRNSNY